jgi:hypothetical protein
MSGFFNYFPSLLYANTATTNIIAKVKFIDSVAKNLAVYYPYVINEGERADQIAAHYYEDEQYDWVVYMSNDIVDPHHEWPKSQYDMDNMLKAKYGSLANAQLQTAYYKVNFETDDSVISPAAYEALAGNQKPYWSPIINENEVILNYERKVLNMIAETNNVIALGGTFANVIVGDVLKQSSTVRGTVSFANTSYVVIKHTSGTWATGTTVYKALDNTIANATITSVTTLHTPIDSGVLSYWTPVSLYDHEHEENEKKKHIRLLSADYLDLVERDMKELLAT